MSWSKPSSGGSGSGGKSAYEIWLDLGNTGTEQDFINSLKGPKGDSGTASLAINDNVTNTVAAWSGSKVQSATFTQKSVPTGITTSAGLTEHGMYRLVPGRLTDLPSNMGNRNTALEAFVNSDGSKFFILQSLFADDDAQDTYIGYKHYNGSVTRWRRLTIDLDRPMVGRKMALLGDSIMTMVDKTVIEKRTGLTVDASYARGGSSVALRSNVNMAPTWDPWALCTRSKVGATNYIPIENFDYAMIFIGTNDWGNAHPLGTPESTDELTILGSYNVALRNFIAINPTIKLLIATPMFRDGGNVANPTGKNLREVGEAIESLAKMQYGIPVLNMMDNGMVNDFNKTNFLVADLLHPNDAGKDLISRMFTSFIMSSY
jgi:lysophospholipase L1-like esterase